MVPVKDFVQKAQAAAGGAAPPGEAGEETRSVSFGRVGGRGQLGILFKALKPIPGHTGRVFERQYSYYAGADELEVPGGASKLVLLFTDRRVALSGWGLVNAPAGQIPLIQYLRDHRVCEIEARLDRPVAEPAGGPVVTGIEVLPVEPDEG